MKKFYQCISIFLTIILCFSGCGGKTQIETGGRGQATEEVTSQFQTGINQFSYQIFEQLDNGENLFISPYSIAIAISMLDNGADGQTKSEIERMLGITDLEKWNACVKYYMSQNKEEQAKLLTANSLWLSDSLTLSADAETDFFQPVEKNYEAEKIQMNLSGEEARNQVNGWVSEHTEHMIEQLLTQQLDPRTEMLILNAVYFKGEWKEKFEKENTVKDNFYGKDKTSKIEFMCRNNTSSRYINKDGITAVELPYGNENIVMDILLPTEETGDICKLFSELSDKEKSDFLKELSHSEEEKLGALMIPKFRMEYGVKNIKEALKALGMKRAFEQGAADGSGAAEFSKIAPDLYADEVLHKAKIEVDEEGTKAAAVTAIEMRTKSCPEIFVANRPFLFVIRDRANDIILFMGSVQNLEEEK